MYTSAICSCIRGLAASAPCAMRLSRASLTVLRISITRSIIALALLISFLYAAFLQLEPLLAAAPTLGFTQENHSALRTNNQASFFYVSKRGDNQDGQSWTTAWNELNEIDWSIIDPGDTILIDGGSLEMIYTTPMGIDSSGTREAPIRIQGANEPGRSGKIILFGGRTNALPHCYQDQYDNQTEGIENFGIRTNDHDWLVIDGLDWRGLTIHGFHESGIRIDRYSENVTIRNVEIYNNGYAKNTSQGWYPEGVGIRLSGPNMIVERAIIHDNGQDAIQSMWHNNNISNFRVSQSWLYNGRPHLTVDESWNYCTHTDGLQIYDGGLISGITFEDSIVGPGFTNGLILGQTTASNGAQADVHNVTLRNVLLTKAADNGLFGYEGSNSRGWTLDHVTMHCPKTKWHCITLDNSDHSITNSIIVGSRLTFVDGLNRYEDNCIWQTSGLELGRNSNPLFANISESDHFSLDDYTVSAESPCIGKGSGVTSVSYLLASGQPSSGSTTLPPPDEPTDPAPGNPTPDEPTPDNPTPGDPTPDNPTPDNPTPGNPTPDNPIPDNPIPGNPTQPDEQAGPLLIADNMNAVDGLISDGFVIEGNTIYQPVDVPLPSEGGLAKYRFQLEEDGFYTVAALVRAESLANNSLFINVDSEPTSDFMIWDVDITLGLQNRTVSWRGNGTFEQNEFVPKNFYLTAGEHVIYVRGREADVYLSRLSVQAVENDIVEPIIRPEIELSPTLYLPFMNN